jgi:hypothetical protein
MNSQRITEEIHASRRAQLDYEELAQELDEADSAFDEDDEDEARSS